MGLENYFFRKMTRRMLQIPCYAKLNFPLSDLRSLLPRHNTFIPLHSLMFDIISVTRYNFTCFSSRRSCLVSCICGLLMCLIATKLPLYIATLDTIRSARDMVSLTLERDAKLFILNI